jgi:hydrogenase maturation protein HypF
VTTGATVPTVPGLAVRRRIRVTGVVQGVGFRPFVHRLATELDLVGFVGNDPGGVFIEVEGSVDQVCRFEDRLIREAPPLSRIFRVDATAVAIAGGQTFAIVESQASGSVGTFVSPDVAVCGDCLDELFDPDDRRYRYPFINCTNCGPRFTITVRLPYDRPNTTMAGFPLCAECAVEYGNPADRRFHAQPIACPACGPHVWFERAGAERAPTPDPPLVGDAAFGAARQALAQGEIVAVKGLGGYHLACDATNADAVATLRSRKHREDKPFAVMVPDLATARQLATVSAAEAALLTSAERPIVLLRRRRGSPVVPGVAPDNPQLGILLPYTPLHYLLLTAVPGVRGVAGSNGLRILVMTSGNLTDEPICYDDADARHRLERIADAWLVHDRPIHVPCDDSVVRAEDGGVLPIRRSRGFAPLPVQLPFDVPPLLAVGGELKNTFCLATGRDAWMSQHLGDMGGVESLAALARSTRQFTEIYEVASAALVADAHPGYHTRDWAERSGGPVQLVQHHHAHIASVMVEHQVPVGERVIGFAFDGTGYGGDGTVWGGEVLVTGYDRALRVAHLRDVPLPGGDSAVTRPYRVALAHLWAAGITWTPDLYPVQAAPPSELTMLRRQLEHNVQCASTSSMGRLFDAVSSLVGVRQRVSYEAQAAMELEHLATACRGTPPLYRFDVTDGVIDPGPVLSSLIADLRGGAPREALAAGFHRAVAHLVAELAIGVAAETGIDRIALSGGVFQNVELLTLVRAELSGLGLRILTHRIVPPNDGGLALGQVAVAGWRALPRLRTRDGGTVAAGPGRGRGMLGSEWPPRGGSGTAPGDRS